MAYLSTLFQSLVILLVVAITSGCNEAQPEDLLLKESDIQSSIDKQLPINGLINVQIHIPDEVASLSGLFAERVVSDPLVEAHIELKSADVSLVGAKSTEVGRVELVAKPIISINLFGVDIAEPLSLQLWGELKADDNKLYLDALQLKENGSFFLNNFVPNAYRSQFIENLSDWFVAYFSAYPLYQFSPEGGLPKDIIDTYTLIIEDDLIRFSP